MDREDKYYIDKGELDFDEIINESKADEQKLIDFAGDSLAKRFLSIKNKLKSPENDIYYWLKKSPIELEDKVNEIENTVSKTKQKEIDKTEGAELVAEENGWKVYRIDNYEASCLYGKGTKWCTASTETSDHFDDYKDEDIKLYYFIKDNEKYALALYPKTIDDLNSYGIKSNYELYDAKDTVIIDFNQIKSLNLPEIPGVELILESLPTKIENGVLIKVYPYNQGEFVIPSSVTSIGGSAFSECRSLTSIEIPSSVTEIGGGAFLNCTSLTSITIPNSVTKIGGWTFFNCTSLTSITIPNSVTEISGSAFSKCTSLTSITIPSSVTSIGGYVFHQCSRLTIYAEVISKPAGWDADWNPKNRPVVWNYKNSTSSNNINESKADEQNLIGFAGDSLAKRFLSIKSRLKSPENDIYYWLKKDIVELEDRVNEIENTVSKTKQKEIEKTEGAELVAEGNGWKVYRIDTYKASCLYGKGTKWCVASTETSSHFKDYKKKGIKFYYFIKDNEKYALALYPKTIDALNHYGIKTNYEIYDAKDTVITDFNQIKSLNLPEIPGVDLMLEVLPTKIEGDVLVKVYPYNQGEFVIPNSVNEIGHGAFSDCRSLTSITIPNSVTEIRGSAFLNCTSLTSITIPNSVTKIGGWAFFNCTSLTSLTIPNSVTEISGSAFSKCTSLTSITIPNSVTEIGGYAFYNCPSLTIYAEATSKPAGWDADWNPKKQPVKWGYNQKTNESIEKKPTHVRFINKNEYDTLQKNGKITPIDTAMRWSGKKSIFTFPLSEYSIKEYFGIAHYLNDAFDTNYSYAVLLKINENIKPILTEYDVVEVESILDKELNFDVTNDGSSYLVPEVRLTHYSKDNVVEIKTISELV